MAHSPRQEGANPAPGSRHKKQFEGVAASAGWRGRRVRAWAAEERRHGCQLPKWVRLGKPQTEDIESGPPLGADVIADTCEGRLRANSRHSTGRLDDPNAKPIASLTNIFSEPALLVCQHSYGWGAQGAGDGLGEHGHRADHGGQSTLALEKVERQPGLRPLHCDEPARL